LFIAGRFELVIESYKAGNINLPCNYSTNESGFEACLVKLQTQLVDWGKNYIRRASLGGNLIIY